MKEVIKIPSIKNMDQIRIKEISDELMDRARGSLMSCCRRRFMCSFRI